MRTSVTLVGVETRDLEQIAVMPGVNVDSRAVLPEGVLEKHREETAEERWRKHAALFDSTANWEGLQCCAIKADHSVHGLMERSCGGQRSWRVANLLHWIKQSSTADQVKRLRQIEEKGHLLLSTFFLQLALCSLHLTGWL